jgi:2'-5' RNA ligase
MPQSAIIVPLAIPRAIEALRRATVPGARLGVPPHVTILYPFLDPKDLSDDVRTEVAATAGGLQAFAVRFAAVSRWPGVVYLEPSPARPFAKLTEGLAARFPGHAPYAGAYDAVVPHLTVGEDADDARLERLAAEVRTHLPFDAAAVGLEVTVESSDHRWRRLWALPFRS